MEGTQQNQNSGTEVRTGPGSNTLSLHNQGAHFSYVYKKTEKLVTAVYMITNFIKDNEPLKWKFRDSALKLLSLNRAFTTVSLSERKDLIKEYQSIAGEIVSLAGIASHGGLISEMNGAVLSREFSALISLMEKDENKKSNDETVVLDPAFFQVAPRALQTDNTKPHENVLYTSYAKPQNKPVTDKGQFNDSTETRPEINLESKPEKAEYLPVKDIKEYKEKASKPADSKDGRQAVILKILSKKSGLNVKDFEDSIKGVSTKTIQRELLSMVASGVLKKEGERRWSTYSLAS